MKKDLYTSAEKKKIKPSEDCQIMYFKSNEKAKNVSQYLKRQFNRQVKEVDYDGSCLFSAILVQISHHTTRYTADMLRKQTAYYLSKHWEIFSNTCEAITDEPLESYIKNLYYGYSYGDILCLGVIGFMWKLRITVVTPDLEELRIFCDVCQKQVLPITPGAPFTGATQVTTQVTPITSAAPTTLGMKVTTQVTPGTKVTTPTTQGAAVTQVSNI